MRRRFASEFEEAEVGLATSQCSGGEEKRTYDPDNFSTVCFPAFGRDSYGTFSWKSTVQSTVKLSFFLQETCIFSE